LNAVIDMPTSCTFSGRFSAVTTTVSMPPLLSAAVPASCANAGLADIHVARAVADAPKSNARDKRL
jgi:hypothetical protein